MSNPERIVRRQLKRSAKDISDEWKRLPDEAQVVLTGGLILSGAATHAYNFVLGAPTAAVGMGASALAGGLGGGAAGGAAAMGGTGIGVGTGTLAATGGGAAGGAGFLGALGAGAKAVGSAINNVNPALLAVGGQALAGAMAPEPERQVDVLREQERIRNSREAPNIAPINSPASGPGYLGSPAGVTTTPQPIREPLTMQQTHVPNLPMTPDVGRWDPVQQRWVNAGERG